MEGVLYMVNEFMEEHGRDRETEAIYDELSEIQKDLADREIMAVNKLKVK